MNYWCPMHFRAVDDHGRSIFVRQLVAATIRVGARTYCARCAEWMHEVLREAA